MEVFTEGRLTMLTRHINTKQQHRQAISSMKLSSTETIRTGVKRRNNGDKDFLKIIAQPPYGCPTNNELWSIPLTLRDRKSELILRIVIVEESEAAGELEQLSNREFCTARGSAMEEDGTKRTLSSQGRVGSLMGAFGGEEETCTFDLF